jgi:hypothetical protein
MIVVFCCSVVATESSPFLLFCLDIADTDIAGAAAAADDDDGIKDPP